MEFRGLQPWRLKPKWSASLIRGWSRQCRHGGPVLNGIVSGGREPGQSELGEANHRGAAFCA